MPSGTLRYINDHWQDPIAGLREMRRVARRVVVFTNDASDPDRFWLNRDYLPEHADLWAGRPSLTELAGAIAARTEPVPIRGTGLPPMHGPSGK